jgi:IMP dehydrogenase
MIEEKGIDPLCFDDILLVPKMSKVDSRSEVNLTMDIGRANLPLPIISAPMDTVTESAMAIAMAQNGGLGIIHRYMSIGEQCREVHKAWEEQSLAVGAAVGAKGDYIERAEQLVGSGASLILVDTANGHSTYATSAVENLRSAFGNSIHIMAGNVATSEAYVELSLAGADSVRVGIGGGSVCTTRQVSGHGVPTLASILNCAASRDWFASRGTTLARLIADGGIRNSGDIVKSFAAGADAVMLGSLLAGTNETPGEAVDGFKSYRGMASADAQNDWRGFVGGAEGVSTRTRAVGPVSNVLADLRTGIQSGCSYSGVDRLCDLQGRATYVRVSTTSLAETRPHAKDNQ